MAVDIYITIMFTCDEVSNELQGPNNKHIHFEGCSYLIDGVLGDVVHPVVADLGDAQYNQRDKESALK